MKNLLAFTAFLAAGFLLGSRRARKAGPINTINMAVEVDTSQAMSQLRDLQKQAEKTSEAVFEATKPVTVIAEFKLRGQDLVAAVRSEGYRTKLTD